MCVHAPSTATCPTRSQRSWLRACCRSPASELACRSALDEMSDLHSLSCSGGGLVCFSTRLATWHHGASVFVCKLLYTGCLKGLMQSSSWLPAHA